MQKQLSEYFENAKGLGVLGTSDSQGKVNAAVYARPHFIDETTVAFIMADRLTHSNIQENSKAVYLFSEEGGLYEGKRLYLTKIKESEDKALIDELRRRRKCSCSLEDEEMKKRFLVYFYIDSVLPLVGDKE